MRVLIANDKFKGSLTATEAAKAIAAGLPASCEIDICPIADGGEGFTETMLSALGGKRITVDTVDALYRPIKARYVITDSGLAVMEMASASGHELIEDKDRNILQSSTYGTGLMMSHAAAQSKTERILIGIGGSATNDGGVGMADALGVLFLDSEEDSLPALPCSLKNLDSIDCDQLAKLPPVDVACDVLNPLVGPEGATAVFGPQKGATPEDQEQLEEFLTKLIKVSKAEEIANRPGAGAAGGLGFGLMHFTKAELHSGFDIVAQALELESRIATADLVITGEGSLDTQSLSGKGPVGVAKMARELGKPVIGLAGHISPEVLESNLFIQHGSLSDFDLPLEELMSRAAELLTAKVRELRDLIPLI